MVKSNLHNKKIRSKLYLITSEILHADVLIETHREPTDRLFDESLYSEVTLQTRLLLSIPITPNNCHNPVTHTTFTNPPDSNIDSEITDSDILNALATTKRGAPAPTASVTSF